MILNIKYIQPIILKNMQPVMINDQTNIIDKNGAVYTKSWVVELILDLCGYTQSNNITNRLVVEPAAGSGAFLCPIIERLVSASIAENKSIIDCINCIQAYELISDSVVELKNNITELLLRYNIQSDIIDMLITHWINHGDYLSTVSAREKADFIIGNPPYIRLEDISNCEFDYRSHYPTMLGRADIYVGFYEAGLKQLKTGGVLGFICSDRWMRNQYGSELRRHITSGYSIETIIEMHNSPAFESDVMAYPAITIIKKGVQTSTVVAKLMGDNILSYDKSIQNKIDHIRNGKTVDANGLQAGLFDFWFKGSEPWPCKSPKQLSLLRYLERNFPPLESFGTQIGIGVATGADKVYITKYSDEVEQDRLLPLALASDIQEDKLEWSGYYLINPWLNDGLVNLNKYPLLSSYFNKYQDILKARNIGKKSKEKWFRTIDRVYPEILIQPKLYIPDIKNRLVPIYDSGNTYPHHNLYYIQSQIWDMEVLGGMLMSDVAQFFVECYGIRMRGGYLRFQAQYLRRICLPDPGDIPLEIAEHLRTAFKNNDRDAATKIALDLYNIKEIIVD